MKKIFALVLCIAMLMSSVCAYAGLPSPLTKMPLNYSADMSFTMTLENADELADFILSFEPDMNSGILDIRTFLGALFDISGKMIVKGDISEDYRKIKLHLGGEATYNVNLNSNLDIAVTPRAEMWIDLDVSSIENPVFDIVLFSPLHTKYIELDVFDIIPGEYKETVLTLINSVLNKQVIDGFNEKSVKLIEKYATIKNKGSECTVIFDNAGMTAMSDELMEGIITPFEALAKSYIPEDVSDGILAQIPDYGEMNILGEDGMVIKYTMSGNKVISEKCDIDIDINISEMYSQISGAEWVGEDELKISFNMTTDATYRDYGRTKISIPELNESNSINFAEVMSSYYMTDYGYEKQYPLRWVDLNPDKVHNINSVMYVPLRQIFEEVYGNNITIENQNGTITITSELFEDFEKITLKEWDGKVYLDNTEYEIGGVAILDGTEFVDNKFFEDVLGWEIYSVYYDVIDGLYYYSASTQSYDWEAEEETNEVHYPIPSVGVSTEYLPFDGGQVYFPLREVIETAYADCASIGYENGKIRIESEYFPGFKVLEMTDGDTKVYADGKEYEVGKIFTENGKAYVHPALFSEVLGWDLWHLYQYMEDASYSFTYWAGY